MAKRAFLIVLDSFGIGGAPDAAAFGDEGSDTLAAIAKSEKFSTPELAKLGMFNIEGVTCGTPAEAPTGSFARLVEQSAGKDTTIGHWEIAGVESPRALPTYPNGFPEEVIAEFSRRTGRGVLCNKPYSGTDVLRDYGEQHMKTGDLIVYTSADSVFQIAAHEEIVPVEKLYEYCEIAREMLQGEHGVGR
ncbi:MAG: phosphopentomutase, partial [Pygmaiobacter massiliensis]|nr:phosphopentomutase [Pygmaiobacter massiliensis]